LLFFVIVSKLQHNFESQHNCGCVLVPMTFKYMYMINSKSVYLDDPVFNV